MGGAAVLDLLQHGRPIQRLVTVTEGMPVAIVVEGSANRYLTGPLPTIAEGSLLPDSYSFERGQSRAASRNAVGDGEDVECVMGERTQDCPVATPGEAVTLASIVEKETGKAAERPMIAGVYCNRLRIGMKLDADPTVIYPVTKGKPLGRRILRGAQRRQRLQHLSPCRPEARSPIRARTALSPSSIRRRPRRSISLPMAAAAMSSPRRWPNTMRTSPNGMRFAGKGSRCEQSWNWPGTDVLGLCCFSVRGLPVAVMIARTGKWRASPANRSSTAWSCSCARARSEHSSCRRCRLSAISCAPPVRSTGHPDVGNGPDQPLSARLALSFGDALVADASTGDVADALFRPGISPCPTEAVVEHHERLADFELTDGG